MSSGAQDDFSCQVSISLVIDNGVLRSLAWCRVSVAHLVTVLSIRK